MRVRTAMRRAANDLVWAVGTRLPHWARESICRVGARLLHRLPLKGLRQWDANVRVALGRTPTAAERRGLVESWLRNNLMSLSLANWSDEDVVSRAIISDEHFARIRESLAGPGLVLALPHMGSWDFAGAWCARQGIKVVSVAERLPSGAYERFRTARAGMGMDIYSSNEPGLLRKLAADVGARRLVCLLSDRDLSGRGLEVTWPGATGPVTVNVPAGPALLARLTGCDLRVVVTIFRGDRVEMHVSEPVRRATPGTMMRDVVAGFADGVRHAPTSWLMLQPLFRS